MKKLIKNKVSKIKNKKDIDLIRDNMDSEWYLNNYLDVKKNNIDPAEHYFFYGWTEGKNPNDQFSSNDYLDINNDVKEARVNPFLHYLKYGKFEGREYNKKEIMAKAAPRYEYISHIDYSLRNEIESIESKYKINFDSIPDAIIKDFKILTFDIWDTVLRRTCHPDEIKLRSARFLLLEAFFELRPVYRDLPTLLKSRFIAENESSRTNDFEYDFNFASQMWLKNVLNDEVEDERLLELHNLVIEHELNSEKSSTYLDPSISEILNNNTGKEKFFISDFYLGKNQILELLNYHQVGHFFLNGYSSCDLYKNKRSGELYDHVLDDMSVPVTNILHFGDNKHADIEKSKEKGISSYHYENTEIIKQRDFFCQAYQSLINGDHTEHCNRILSRIKNNYLDIDVSTKKSLVTSIGFVLYIIEEAKKNKLENIYFFTREGIFLKRLYDEIVRLDPYNTNYPKSHLLEVSRLATFLPSLREISLEELMRMWNQYSIQTPKAFIKTLKLDESIASKKFKEYGFELNDDIVYPWMNDSFVSLFNDEEFNNHIKNRHEEERISSLEYLNSFENIKHKEPIMIVDIGWRGTIHDNICHMLPENYIFGAYLGLFKYLNKQPVNSSKVAWLFDLNRTSNVNNPYTEVAPLEMIFNGSGGSTIGYMRSEGNLNVVKKVIDGEESIINDTIIPIQNDIIKMSNLIVDYIKNHGLLSKHIRELSYSLIDNLLKKPTSYIADAFYSLEHNEEFGNGKSDDIRIDLNKFKEIGNLDSSEIHFQVNKLIESSRWKEAFPEVSYIKDAFSQLPIEKQLHLPSSVFTSLYPMKKGTKVGFFVPGPLVGSGGHRTIFNLARKFYEFGAEIYIFLESEGAGVECVKNYLQETKAHVFLQWHKHFELDIGFATIASSARFVNDLDNVKHKCYLVQDFEAMFNPMGDGYHNAEQSYIYPLQHLTVGNWLSDVLKKQFNTDAFPAGLGCDTATYFPKIDIENKEKAICFLYQPEKPRRSPDLAIHALRLVKKKHPDVKIYVYGSNAPINLDFEVENLGLIHNLSEINELYNKCRVGLCISMSNPSRIPYELMAAGVVPVDIYRYNNLLDFRNDTSVLSYQSEFSLSSAICELLENDSYYLKRRDNCINFVKSRTLEWEREAMFNAVSYSYLNDLTITREIFQSYDCLPIIDKFDEKLKAKDFCQYQYNLAKQ